MLPRGAPEAGWPRTLLPGEPQPLPVAHRGWHRTSHAACTEHCSRHAWHWCPLIFFSLKAPFLLGGDLGSWQKVVYMLPELGWKQKHHQSHKAREVLTCSICVARDSDGGWTTDCFSMIKVKREQANRHGMGGKWRFPAFSTTMGATGHAGQLSDDRHFER